MRQIDLLCPICSLKPSYPDKGLGVSAFVMSSAAISDLIGKANESELDDDQQKGGPGF